jgi:hypothetical protein
MTEVNRILGRTELLKLLEVIGSPKKHGLTQQMLEEAVTDFCAGSPDPVKAYSLFTECLDPMKDEEFVDRALNMPYCPMSTVPLSIVPANHPARTSGD